MNPLEGALRILLTDVRAARAYQDWKAKGGGGQTTGSVPRFWGMSFSDLIYAERTILHAFKDAGMEPPVD